MQIPNSVPPSPPRVSPCMMFSSFSFSYQTQFPTLGKHIDPSTKVSSQPYVQSPVTPVGQLEEPHLFEAIPNWQTQNATAQNAVL